MTATVPVVTAADAGYVPYLAAFLTSIGKNAGASVGEVVILFRDIGRQERLVLGSLLKPPSVVRWIEVTPDLCSAVGAPTELWRAPPNYFRLLTPYVCSGGRALYVDADVIALGSLSELLCTPSFEQPVAAAADWLPTMEDAVQNWRELGIDGDAPYFNSGVLLMNLRRWREKDLSARVLNICVENRQFLLAQGRWPQHEQYGLNVALVGDWLCLDRRWNHFSELAPSEQGDRLVHFVGQGKPTSPRCHRAFSTLFFEMISDTPWLAAFETWSRDAC